MMDFNGIDGKELLNAALFANAAKDDNKMVMNLMKVFSKYKIDFMDGIAMLLELTTVLQGDDENDG